MPRPSDRRESMNEHRRPLERAPASYRLILNSTASPHMGQSDVYPYWHQVKTFSDRLSRSDLSLLAPTCRTSHSSSRSATRHDTDRYWA